MCDLFNSANVNSIGLACDLLGIVFVAYSFKNIRREKDAPSLLAVGGDEYRIKEEKEHKFLIFLDRLGMFFLIVGFGLQIVSNYIA